MSHVTAFLLAAVTLLTACSATNPKQTLYVFAASSLTDAFESLSDRFEASSPHVTVISNYAGSSQLATQLVEGAQADVFASASVAQMQAVEAEGLIVGKPLPFATNSLTIIVPEGNPAGIRSVDDLTQPSVTLIVAVPGVPIREYSERLLDQLGDPLAAGIRANIASEEANVRQIVAKVVLGEADAGIVYTSDVTPDIQSQVQTIAVPESLDPPPVYTVAVTTTATERDLAAQFVAFVRSKEGQAILQEWGFGPRP